MTQWPGNAKTQKTTFGALTRSDLMARVRSSGNATTELRLIKLLRIAKISGWRRNSAIAGKPDLVFPKAKLAIFVDGCFWHGHNCKRNLTPKRNAALWTDKISRNKARDVKLTASLRRQHWDVIRLWECNLNRNPQRALSQIRTKLAKRLR